MYLYRNKLYTFRYISMSIMMVHTFSHKLCIFARPDEWLSWCGDYPDSLTHWKKWYPSLFSSLKNTPFFEAKHRLLSSKRHLFRNKTLTFQSKMNPLFCGTTYFSAQMNPYFHSKTLDIKINPFFSKFTEVLKYPLFLAKCESWISSKNTPLFMNFRTRMGVVK